MKIPNPNCPNCNVALEYDDRLNEEIDFVVRNDNLFIKEICRGHCPECKQHYTWNALYGFARNEELEREDAD